MTRTNKLGLTAVACAALACTPPYEPWKQPVNALLFLLAFVLGYIAAQKGSRWWLAVPVSVVVVLVTVLALAFLSYN